MSSFEAISKEIEANKDKFIQRLRDAVEIPSISAEAAHRGDVCKMLNWAQELFQKLGVKCEQKPNGVQTLPDGTTIDLPPILFGQLGSDPNKKTLLVYGHLDVQPAAKSDGWDTEPFQLIEKDGKLFGRGSTDDKGPVIAWANAIETMQKLNVPVPVNIKFVFEGMEESGSEGLDDVLRANKEFLSDVDFTCISDNYWLGKKKPCLTYGLRGISYYTVEVSGVSQDLHSGVYGGAIFEPMNDLIWLMSQLTTVHGQINIPGLSKLVAPVTEEEMKTYETIDFDHDDFRADVGAPKLLKSTKHELLMNRWRFPSLSLHGIEGAFSGPGAKTVIPSKVIGKFSIRTVPDMEPKAVDELVLKYLNDLWAQRGSPNAFKPVALQGGRPWVAEHDHPNFEAGKRAIQKVFGVAPDLTREGGSIPVTLTFQELTGQNVMLLPIGSCNDMAHSQNEKIDVSNYINGTKVLAAYLLELAA
uniref:M20_dimer domain-containing protein n=1 Tax=Steinernema glaseri TaxID=37863 RepID=A0A1I7YS90_9BILA